MEDTLIRQGDISSFTNSNPGGWLVVLALLTKLLTGHRLEHLRPSFPILVEGRILECTMGDILYAYLRLTVGATAMTPYGPHTATGGYLGVKGNISLTLLSFSIECEEMRTKLKHSFPRVSFSGQLGGDDYYFEFVGPYDEIVQANAFVSNYIQRVVGREKEPSTTLVHKTHGFESRLPIPFCKKTVRYHVSYQAETALFTTAFHSLRKLPVMGELLEKERLSYRDRLPRFYSFYNSILYEASPFPDAVDDIVKNYLYAYVQLYSPPMGELVRVRKVLSEASIHTVGREQLTVNAYRVFLQSPAVVRMRTGVEYKLSTSDRLRILSRALILKQSKAHIVGVGEARIYFSQQEPAYSKIRTYVPRPPDVESIGHRLVHELFQEVRNLLSSVTFPTFVTK